MLKTSSCESFQRKKVEYFPGVNSPRYLARTVIYNGMSRGCSILDFKKEYKGAEKEAWGDFEGEE